MQQDLDERLVSHTALIGEIPCALNIFHRQPKCDSFSRQNRPSTVPDQQVRYEILMLIPPSSLFGF
jgi:hypothetical protein